MSSKLIEIKNSGTNLLTVRELLSSGCYFRIPDYQRGYAWRKEFIELWNDILRLYHRADKKSKHYTGMLALDEISNDELKQEALSGHTAFYIVDGQQRITSIVILIKSLIDYLAKENEDFDSEIYDSLLFSKEQYQYKFDYSSYRTDSATKYFKERIFDNKTTSNSTNYYFSNINDAKNYIDLELNKYDYMDALDILNVILDEIVFNIYFVTDDFDVRVTFETMNNRGKKLSNLEILKNRLMYLSSLFPEECNFGEMIKSEINNTWKNIYENLCLKTYSLQDDAYLKTHWIVYKDLKKNKGNAYIEQILEQEFSMDKGQFYSKITKKNFKDAYSIIHNYICSLEHFCPFWTTVEKPDEPKINIEEIELYWIKRLARISDNFYLRATLMVVLEQTIDIKAKCDFYVLIEKFLFINKLLAKSDNDLSFLITSAQKFLENDNILPLNKLKDLCSKISNHELGINCKRLKSALKEFKTNLSKDYNNEYYYGWNGLKYFLYEYNESLAKQNTMPIKWYELNNVSVEHVLPQTPESYYWKTAFGKLLENEELKWKVINSLGNLLLLSNGAENSSLKNYSFPIKKEMTIDSKKFAYCDGSYSARKIAENAHWTMKELDNRTDELLDFMYDYWFKDIPNIDELNWKDVKEDLKLIKYSNEMEKDYYKLIEKLDSIDVSEERCAAVSKLKPKHNINLGEQFLNYVDKTYFDTWCNKSQIRYCRNAFVFKIKKQCETNEPEIFECVTISDDNSHIRIEYNYIEKTLKIKNETLDFYYEKIEDVDMNIQKYIRSFKRYLKNAYGVRNISYISK